MTGRGGRASRQKGDRFERQLVRILQEAGFGAERVPLSGSAGGSYAGDFTTPLLGLDLRVEAKVRATGFAQLYDWLQGRDALVVKADRRPALVVLPISTAVDLMKLAEGITPRRHKWRGRLRSMLDTMAEEPIGEPQSGSIS